MAVINVKDEKIKKVIVKSSEDLLEWAEKLAPGMRDAILEFFIDRKTVPIEVITHYDDVIGPDEESDAGIDNQYYGDKGEPI